MSADHTWLHDLFQAYGPVSIRRMFGGAGIYRDDLMFALATGGEVYLKTDDETVERYRDAGSRPFSFVRQGKEMTTSYWSVPAEALDDPALMAEWAEAGYQAALRAKERPARKRAPSRKRAGRD